ncbi:MAG: glycosyltransferase [Gammaproteobacteria bacterium]
MDADELLIACVAEDRRDHHIKVANLVGTIRSFGGSLASARIAVNYVESVDSGIRASLEEAGADVRVVPRFDPRCPHANKLRMLEQVAGVGLLVAMDVDMAVVRDFRSQLHTGGISAKIVDLNPLSETQWHQLFDYAGLPMPGQRYVCSSDGGVVPPYFNSGLLTIPVQWISSLRASWGAYVAWLLDARMDLPWLEQHAFFTDQLALALALQAIQCPVIPLPIEMNFPTHIPVAPNFHPDDVEPYIVHYHDRVNADGTLGLTAYRAPNLGIKRVNESIIGNITLGDAGTASDRFSNSVFWEKHYRDAPDLGSGVGSRAQFARYKSVIIDQLTQEMGPASVLDVGCGDLASVAGRPWPEYTGIDIAGCVIERNRTAFPHWKFLPGDFLELSESADIDADLVLCFDVLIHEHDPIRYEQIVGKLLRSTGRCLMIGGYDSPPLQRYSSGINAFHEPLSDTLRRYGVTRIVRIGGYRGVTMLRVDLDDGLVTPQRRRSEKGDDRGFAILRSGTRDDTTPDRPQESSITSGVAKVSSAHMSPEPVAEGESPEVGDMPQAILIVGMHRSGTSALARVLNLHGVRLGSRMIPPQDDNARGFWEHPAVMALNERVLAYFGGAWDRPGPLRNDGRSLEEFTALLNDAATLVDGEFSATKLWGIKDPRLCRTLPFWHRVLERARTESRHVLVIRNPLEIAASLAKRDGFSQTRSLLLWFRYLLDAEHDSRGTKRVFITYEQLLGDWRSAIRHLASGLGVVLDPETETVARRVEAFLSPQLRHHHMRRPPTVQDHARLGPLAAEFYDALLAASHGDESGLADLDRLRSDIELLEQDFNHKNSAPESTSGAIRSMVEPEAILRQLGRPLRVGILSTERKEWGCAHIRLVSPLASLQNQVEVIWAVPEADATARIDFELLDSADLFVVQRFFPSAVNMELIRLLLSSGKPVIYEADDLVTAIPEANPGYAVAAAMRPYILETVTSVHALTVSTEELRRAFASYNSNIYILPNLLDDRLWNREPVDGSAVVVIGYVGTWTHLDDLEIIEPALEIIAKIYGSRVRFEFAGCISERLRGLPNLTVREFQPGYAAYAQTLQGLGVDIAVAPLRDTAFNRVKSNIKWLEYSACGIAGVYSAVPPYVADVVHGETGLLAGEDVDEWVNAIASLVESRDRRLAIAGKARERVLADYTASRGARSYLQAYVDVLANFQTRPNRMPQISAEYELWRERRSHRVATRLDGLRDAPAIHLIVCLHEGQEAALADTVDTLAAQTYGGWGLSVVADFPCRQPDFEALPMCEWVASDGEFQDTVNQLVATSQADWLAQIDVGDRFDASLLASLAHYLALFGDWRVVYVDEDVWLADGRRVAPKFKPDFNLDLLRSTPYVGALCFVRRDVLVAIGGFSGGDGLSRTYDTVLRVLEHSGEKSVGHVPDLLFHRSGGNAAAVDFAASHGVCRRHLEAHLQRCGVHAVVHQGRAEGTQFIEYPVGEHCRVSVVIPTDGRLRFLEPCIRTVLSNTEYPDLEVVVVTETEQDPSLGQCLYELMACDNRVRVVSSGGENGVTAALDAGVREASGEYVLLLHDDTLIVQKDWLSRMVSLAKRDDVGVVGVKLVFPDQRIQNSGIILGGGPWGVAECRDVGKTLTDPGYLGRLACVQDLSAVSGACLMIRAELYRQVMATEMAAAGHFWDVALCLRVGRLGYKVVWTPYVTVVHHHTSVREACDADRRGIERDAARMRAQWLGRLASDPAYNRNLSLTGGGWRPDVNLFCPWDPALREDHRIVGVGAGSYGSWRYRLADPLAGLEGAGRARPMVVEYYSETAPMPTVTELARLGPDTLFMHNAVHDSQIALIKEYRELRQGFVVFGQDDLMFELPGKNPFQKTVFKDIKRRLRTCIGLADRLVVTTEPLAEAYREWAQDVRIVPNYLERSVWGALRSERRTARRPRVGWAGAMQHGGDLEILIEVVKETAGELDWVFFGMCLEELRPLAAELCPAVAFDDYPKVLARLNLDLAVAPLARNRFNEAKSNLRILEYGALGWPVVCSDIQPYRDAPVCRVPNNSRAWIEAIRERAHDLDAAAVEGDRLRDWVLRDWMLEDHLEQWLEALVCPGAAVGGADIQAHGGG